MLVGTPSFGLATVFKLLKYPFKGIKIVYDQKFVESQIDIIIHGISRVCQLARRVKVNIVLYYLYRIVESMYNIKL